MNNLSKLFEEQCLDSYSLNEQKASYYKDRLAQLRKTREADANNRYFYSGANLTMIVPYWIIKKMPSHFKNLKSLEKIIKESKEYRGDGDFDWQPHISDELISAAEHFYVGSSKEGSLDFWVTGQPSYNHHGQGNQPAENSQGYVYAIKGRKI